MILTVVYWCRKNRDNKPNNILMLGAAEVSWTFVKNASHSKFIPVFTAHQLIMVSVPMKS